MFLTFNVMIFWEQSMNESNWHRTS